MADDEQFSLCWNNFNSNLSAGFHESLCRGDLVDVTLAAEGQLVKAHRLVLSVCSPYFRKMFTQMPANQHAFVFLKDVSHTALKDLIQFMYCGEVNVKQEALPAFISTAEALQIKGLTDSDPPSSQSPGDNTTNSQPQIQQISSPRVRQRTTTSRATYKIDTLDDNGDKIQQQPTQIVIQTTAAPSQQQTINQQQHIQTLQQQQHVAAPIVSSGTTTTATVVSHKRSAQRSSIGSAGGSSSSGGPHIKRTKSTIDPLEVTEMTTSGSSNNQQSQSQQISLQTTVIPANALAESKSQQQQQHTSDTEYIDLPMEIPTKAEPDYVEDAGDVDTGDNDGAGYVEDDSYGNMGYDETYFTENEDGPTTATATGGAATSGASATATTSKAVVKQQPQSYSDTSYVETGDQSNNDAQETELLFIESPWATPCLILNDYMYNCHSRKNNKEYWRCHNYSKKEHSQRCRARCVLECGRLKAISGGDHNHLPHTEKINKMIQRNRMLPKRSLKLVRHPSHTIIHGETTYIQGQPQPHQQQLQPETILSSASCKYTIITNDRVRYREGNKNSYQLVLDNHPFTRHGVHGTKIYWRCVQFRPLKCRARLRTDLDGHNVTILRMEHNHEVLSFRRKKGEIQRLKEFQSRIEESKGQHPKNEETSWHQESSESFANYDVPEVESEIDV